MARGRTTLRLACAALLALGGVLASERVLAGGNTQIRDPANPSVVVTKRWDDRFLPIRWVLSRDGIPGSGISNATLASQLGAAFGSWESLPTSSVTFSYGGEVNLRDVGGSGPLGTGIDGRNLVTFTDPGVLFPSGVLAVALTFSFTQPTLVTAANADLDGNGTPDIPTGLYPAGAIFDADIAFNSSELWSTSGADGSADVRAVGLHEIGHFLGLCHSAIRDATMWPFLAADIAAARTLEPDDIAWASHFYPAQPAYSQSFGAIRGRVTNGFNGNPVLGAHVYSVEPLTGRSRVGAYSGDDGSFLLPGLAPGPSLVAMEPLDGDPLGLDPFRINQVVQSTFDTGFPEEFYDSDEGAVEADPAAATTVTVAADAEVAGIDLVTNTLQVPGVNLILPAGYSLISYPVEVPAGLAASDLLQALGAETAVNTIDRRVPGTSLFERAEYVGQTTSGANFPIRRGEGYVVHMDAQAVVSFAGRTDCPNLDLVRGLNLVGVPCPPAGYTAFRLLLDLGDASEVDRVERFDAATGSYQVARLASSGVPSGVDFPVRNGEGYAVYMRADKAGVRVPGAGVRGAPVLTGISPGRGVPGSVVLISGEGFDPDVTKNVVTFRGVGAGVVFATATSLTVTVPAGATSGAVRAFAGGRASNALDFVVESPLVQESATGETELVSGQTAAGELAADGEQDRYTFIARAGSLVTAEARSLTPGVPNLVLLLEDPNGVTLAIDDNSAGGTDPRINNRELESTGVHTLVVSNVPGSGTGPYRLTLTITTRSAPTTVTILEGDLQNGLAGSALPLPLEVLVTGETGAPVAGAMVTFVATEVSFGTSALSPIDAGTIALATNGSGIATVTSSLPNAQGAFRITVTGPGGATARFDLAATATAVTSITLNGDRQSGIVGQPLAQPLEVVLRDASGNPVPNAWVELAVVSGRGTLVPPGKQQTDATGAVRSVFTLGQKTSQAQIVAAGVGGQPKPFLLSATPQADSVRTARSNRSNFNRLTLDTARLNAMQVEVYDRYDNPVPDVTVQYNAPAGFTVAPGLGKNGLFYPDFKTDAEGKHVALLAVSRSVRPSIDEFGTNATPGLAGTYPVTATVQNGTSPVLIFLVDVDMGPTQITGSTQGAAALIGRPLTNPVRKSVLRFQRVDGPDADKDFRNEPFAVFAEQPVGGVAIRLSVDREDGESESAAGYQPTRTATPTATTDASGVASVGVTMGDVGGVNFVQGEIDLIHVDFNDANGALLLTQDFTDARKFLESTVLQVLPVVVTVTIDDSGSGIDLRSVTARLNPGTLGRTFFDGAAAPRILPKFPEKLTLRADGIPLQELPPSLVDGSGFSQVQIEWSPAKPWLLPSNDVQVDLHKDRAGNTRNPVTGSFTYP